MIKNFQITIHLNITKKSFVNNKFTSSIVHKQKLVNQEQNIFQNILL